MTNSQRLATVRSHLRWWLGRNAAEEVSSPADVADESLDPIVAESILIVDGFYAGRTFESASHRATWFMEPDELKVHGTDGTVQAVFRGEEIVAEHPAEPIQVEIAAEIQEEALPDDPSEFVVEPAAAEEDEMPASIPMTGHAAAAEKTSENDIESDDSDNQLPKAA